MQLTIRIRLVEQQDDQLLVPQHMLQGDSVYKSPEMVTVSTFDPSKLETRQGSTSDPPTYAAPVAFLFEA